MTRLIVAGDSVPAGANCAAPAWPTRVADRVGASVRVAASMGWELADAGEQAIAVLDELTDDAIHADSHAAAESAADHTTETSESVTDDTRETTVLVHAGHNDCQLSGGNARVSLDRFAEAAQGIDARLADDERVARHAFVGLVPMGLTEGVPFAGDQPARSRRYDDRLAGTVAHHVPIADATDWNAATVDGVHPNDAGHAAIADRVVAWLGV